VAPEARHLYGTFDSLSPTVAEKGLSAPPGAGGESFSQQALGFGMPTVGDMDQPANLIAYGVHHAMGAMAHNGATPTGEEVEIFATGIVPYA
jgi:hypothetical protein